jgi:hypothetical protein
MQRNAPRDKGGTGGILRSAVDGFRPLVPLALTLVIVLNKILALQQ